MKKSIGAHTIVFPTPVWVVGTYDAKGDANLMTVSWCGICCSKPPCLQISVRKETSSYHNLMRKHAFTVNVPSDKYVKEADYIGMVSGKMQDKVAASNLTAERAATVDAPCVLEFPLVLDCKIIHTLDIGMHTLFVGEISDVRAEEEVLDSQGHPDITKVAPVVFAPQTHAYYKVGESLGKAFSSGASLINAGVNKVNF